MPDEFLRALTATRAPHAECAALIREHHYAGSCANTSVYAIGLFHPDRDDILGAQLWMPTTPTVARSLTRRHVPTISDEDAPRRVLALSRLALVPGLPTNTASRFLALGRRLVDRDRFPLLVTWADTNQGHDGTIYRADNWLCDNRTSGGDVYRDPVTGRQVARRATRTRTATEMRNLGYVRAGSLPKIRYVRLPDR